MPRQPRFVLPEVAVHLIQRGNDRKPCFREDSDCMVYLSCLRQLAPKSGCALHAFCLMPNHVHLLLTPSSADACGVLMRDLGQRYVQYFNRKYRRTGTLWEGRFRSCVAESARYVLACYRYVELNPVRARIVSHPAAYSWSSYSVNAGLRNDSTITPHAEYVALGSGGKTPSCAYREMVNAGLDEVTLAAIREATQGGYPLGSEAFRQTVATLSGRNVAPGKPGPRMHQNNSGSDPEFWVSGGGVS